MNYQTLRSGGGFLSSIPPVVKNLLIINVLIFIASQVSYELTYKYLALYYFQSPLFMPHQLLTHMFMHGSPLHILFNMYALWMFGSPLEQVWGSKRFLIFYLITGVGAALFFTLVQWIQLQGFQHEMSNELFMQLKTMVNQPNFSDEIIKLHAASRTYSLSGAAEGWFSIMTIPMVGASGAIFGVLLGFGMLFPNAILQLIFPPVALKAKYFVMIYGALELFLGISQPGSSVAHFAHVGGMLFGFILIRLWSKRRRTLY